MNDSAAATVVQTQTRPAPAPAKPRQPWLWNVVLLDDNDHSYDYVIRMMQTLFHHPLERAVKIAQEVDKAGRAIVLTTHKEHAELKREQVHAFGADKLIASCTGSMWATIEPATGGDDQGGGEPPAGR
jgi:ATP-dependent Clp protease adaptor protein ClpS